ncbi:MAG: hypothetical protein ATN35_02110 [Epulopiscium sp. Nele67-Bin004]|nr:MAG: hypothetical protein ATN35_02110 [Epulopiscium sp. Nele67-Bin004]
MITERDQKAISFVDLMKVATTNQIDRAIYQNRRVAQRRLAEMCNLKVLSRTKNLYSNEYLYALGGKVNTNQLKHKLVRTDVYLELLDLGTIKMVLVEELYGQVRPDMLVLFEPYGSTETFFLAVEIEVSNNTIKSKYNKLKSSGARMPIVLYITEKKVKGANYDYLIVKPDLSDLDKQLRSLS